MFPETTIFAVLVVLAIVVTLIFLLIRKPHFRFRLTRVDATEREKKSNYEHELMQTSKTRPPRVRYIDESLENAPTPHEQSGSLKTTGSQTDLKPTLKIPHSEDGSEKPTIADQTAATLEKPRSIDQITEAPRMPTAPAETPNIIEEKRMPTFPTKPQLRPSNCTHFFGYLRKIPKNSPMPDECFGCPRMVECLYYNITPE